MPRIPRSVALALAGLVLTVTLAGCGATPSTPPPAPTPDVRATRTARNARDEAARNSARLDELERAAREACYARQTIPDFCK